jgi:hypothetical protein
MSRKLEFLLGGTEGGGWREDAAEPAVPAPLLRAGPLRAVLEGLLEKDPHRRLSADEAGVALRAIHGPDSPAEAAMASGWPGCTGVIVQPPLTA